MQPGIGSSFCIRNMPQLPHHNDLRIQKHCKKFTQTLHFVKNFGILDAKSYVLRRHTVSDSSTSNRQRGRKGKDVVFTKKMILGSTRILVTLLRTWMRRFTMIFSAWWLRTSKKFTWEELKRQSENGQLLNKCGLRIRPRIAPPSLSRERRIKMHQSIINTWIKLCNLVYVAKK